MMIENQKKPEVDALMELMKMLKQSLLNKQTAQMKGMPDDKQGIEIEIEPEEPGEEENENSMTADDLMKDPNLIKAKGDDFDVNTEKSRVIDPSQEHPEMAKMSMMAIKTGTGPKIIKKKKMAE